MGKTFSGSKTKTAGVDHPTDEQHREILDMSNFDTNHRGMSRFNIKPYRSGMSRFYFRHNILPDDFLSAMEGDEQQNDREQAQTNS